MIKFFKSIFAKNIPASDYAKAIVRHSNNTLISSGFNRYKFYYHNGEISLFEFLTTPEQFYPVGHNFCYKILSLKLDGYLVGMSYNDRVNRYNSDIIGKQNLFTTQDQFYLFDKDDNEYVVLINVDALRKIFKKYEESDKTEGFNIGEYLLEFIIIQPSYAIVHSDNEGLYYKLYDDWTKTDSKGMNGLGGHRVAQYYGRNRNKFKESLTRRPQVENLAIKRIEEGNANEDFILDELKSFLDKDLSDEMRERLQKTIDDYTFETEEAKRQREIVMNDMKASVLIDTVRNNYLEKKEDDAHG